MKFKLIYYYILKWLLNVLSEIVVILEIENMRNCTLKEIQ